jgi:O-acetyl-ADP-ribose deacetylase (regulator of RNase III)
MIEEISADIFEEFSKSEVPTALVHQANCFCTMGSGIARLIREKFPSVYDADCSTKPGDKEKLGEVSFAPIGDNKVIFNLYGQYRYGHDKRYTDYEAVYSGLEKIKESCESAGIELILIPYKMSSNLAGGDWRIVEKMIEVVFETFNGDVRICKLEKFKYEKTKSTKEIDGGEF